MNNTYYNVEQIAEMLDMHPKTIQRYIREGKLKATKIGKSWRVSGHDLSLFTEGNRTEKTVLPTYHTQTATDSERVSVSSVVDINVLHRDEAIRIINTLQATMNVKPPEMGRALMHAQFIEPENTVRITLWGGLKFVATILEAIDQLIETPPL
jgi:excisionase family DNA binding protein